MNPQILMYSLYGFFGLIILLAGLTGVRRGLRKSLYWLIVEVLFFIIFFSTMNFVSKGIYFSILSKEMPKILKLFGLEGELVLSKSFMLQVQIIGQIVIKIVYFFVLWMIYYLISWILWLTVFKKLLLKPMTSEEKKTYKAEKKARKNAKIKETKAQKRARIALENEKYHKPKKRRLLGGAVGLVRGVFSSFIILCILNGIIAILPEVNRNGQTVASNDGETLTNADFYDFLVEKTPELEGVLEYLEVYQKSPLNKVTKFKINGVSIDICFNDAFLSGSYKNDEGQKVQLNILQELKNLLTIGNKAYELTNGFDVKSVDFMALNPNQQKLVSDILNLVASDSFIIGSIPAVIAYGMINENLSKKFEELGIDDDTFKNINWKKDILTISSIVDDVYALGEDYNLKKIDYLDLDIERVEIILENVAKLTVLQPAFKIGARQLLKMESIQKIIGEKQEDFLDDITLENEFTNIAEIYNNFVDTGINAILKEKKEENDGKVNILQVITSLSEEGNESAKILIHNLFESIFVQKVIRDVLNYFLTTIQDSNLREMINLDVLGEDWNLWTNELTTVLNLLKEISKNGTEPLEKLDVKVIKNITVDTLLQSNLLKEACKTFLVKSAKGEMTIAPDITKYIDLPEELKDVNSPLWDDQKEQAGELRKSLTAFKSVLDCIDDFDDILGSLPKIIDVLDAQEGKTSLIDSDLIYYSLNKALPMIPTNQIAIPKSPKAFDEKENKITRDELKALFKAVNQIPLEESGLLYKKYDTENPEKYKTTFSADPDNIMAAVMNIELSQLKIMMNSDILAATISQYIDVYAKDFIVLPTNTYQSYKLYGADSSLNVIKGDELACLINALGELKDDKGNMVDFTTLEQNPEQIINYIQIESAKRLFIKSSNSYSTILHATASKYIINLDTEGSIAVPSKAYEDDKMFIKGKELVNMITAVKKANIQDFTAIETDPMMILDELDEELIESILIESKDTYSSIMHATLSKYLISPEGDQLFIIPPSIVVNDGELSYISGTEIVKFAIVMKQETFKNLSLNSFTLGDLTIRGIKECVDEMNESYIIRSTITNYIIGTKMTIPTSAYDNEFIQDAQYYITKLELESLVDSIYQLFIISDDDDPTMEVVNNLNISSFTLDQIDNAKQSLSNSKIVRKLLTKQAENEFGVLPTDCLDADDDTIVSKDEMLHIIGALKALGIESFENVAISDISITQMNTNLDTILESILIHHVISNELTQHNEIVVPSNALDSKNRVSTQQIKNLLNALIDLNITDFNKIPASADLVNSITKELATKIFTGSEKNGYSIILQATMSKQLLESSESGLVIVDEVKVMLGNQQAITGEELVALINAVKKLDIQDLSSPNFNFETNKALNVSNIKNNLTDLLDSKIIHATISKQLRELNDDNIVIPNTIYVDNTYEYVKESELRALLNGLEVLGIDSLNSNDLNLDFENNDALSVSNFKTNLDDLLKSQVLHATISKKLSNLDNEAIIIPNTIYKDNEHVFVKESELQALLNSLDILGVNVLTSTALENLNTLNIQTLSSGNNLDALLASEIMYYTISKEIISQTDNDLIVVPDEVKVNDQILEKAEIKALVKALSITEVVNIDSIVVDDIVSKSFNLDDKQINTVFDSMIIEKTASMNIKEHFSGIDAFFKLPNVVVPHTNLTINYVDNDIDKEEMVNLIRSTKVLGFTSLDLNEFTLEDFLNKGFNESNIEVVISSKINSYNLGKQIVRENEDGIFNNLLTIPDDANWFRGLSYNGEPLEDDLYPFISSMMGIYDDQELKPLFDIMTSSSSNKDYSVLNNASEAAYANLANYVSNGRILLASTPSIAQEFLNSYSGEVNVTIPSDEDIISKGLTPKAYWRGTTDDIRDGELYKFFIGINSLVKYEEYRTVDELVSGINNMRASSIIKPAFENDVLFNKTVVSGLNIYREMHGQSPLVIPASDASQEEVNNYINEFASTIIAMRNN